MFCPFLGCERNFQGSLPGTQIRFNNITFDQIQTFPVDSLGPNISVDHLHVNVSRTVWLSSVAGPYWVEAHINFGHCSIGVSRLG